MSIDASATATACSTDRSELEVLLEFVDWIEDDFPDLAAASNAACLAAVKEQVVADSKPSLIKPKAKRGASEGERLHKAREKERRRYYRNKVAYRGVIALGR